MFKRCVLALLPLVILMACETGTEVPAGPGLEVQGAFDISDAANDGNPNFFFLPPMVKDPGASGTFDPTASPVVEICEFDVGAGTCAPAGAVFPKTFTMSNGIVLDDVNELFQLNWKTDDVTVGATYRIVVKSGVALLGYADVAFPESKGQAKNTNDDDYTIVLADGRTLPIKFRIEMYAELTAVGCVPDGEVVEDCDVQFVPAGQVGTVEVIEPDGHPAGRVEIPVTGGDVFLSMKLLNDEGYVPSDDIPADKQIPFFVEIKAVDAAGQKVLFDGDGAELILCQDDGDTRHLYNSSWLKLFRVDDQGQTHIHEETYVDASGWCENSDGALSYRDEHGHLTGHSRLAVLMDRTKKAVGSFVFGAPLHAVHGGLNGKRVTEFSDWGATEVPPTTGLPDLVVSDISVPTTTIEYGATPWTWATFTVTNLGPGTLQPETLPTDVYSRHVVRVEIVDAHRDGQPVPRSGYMNIPVTDPWGPGESLEYSFAVGHDNGWPEGDWVIQVHVDIDNQVEEENEGNNISEPLEFTVVSLPDLIVAQMLAPSADVVYGQTPASSVTVLVQNQGAGTLDPTTLPTNGDGLPVIRAEIVEGTRNGEAQGGFGYMSIPVLAPLAPGETLTYSFNVGHDAFWQPVNETGDDWIIRVQLDSDDQVLEQNETNNLGPFRTFRVVPLPSTSLITPELAFLRMETRNGFDYYYLSVTNWAQYSDVLFTSLGDANCDSRTHLRVYRSTGLHLQGFCVFDTASDMQEFWFALTQGSAAPDVYITLWDRLEDVTVQSNTITIP